MTATIQDIALKDLHAHPANSNVMDDATFKKLQTRLQCTGQYPPLVVRVHPDEKVGGYQIIDGHHRAKALRELSHESVQCIVWDVNDEQTLVLLASLNRLQGQDDPKKRASLVASLHKTFDLDTLAAALPEDVQGLEKLLNLYKPPKSRPPRRLEDMPIAVHFFLLPAEKRMLDRRLREIGADRNEALMSLVFGDAQA